MDYGADAPVDFPALRARAHMSAPAVLWITGFALWISQHFVLGRIYPLAELAVD